MSFKMRPEVDDWFRHIFKQGPIQTKFDLYYFCLMMGLAEGKGEPANNAVEFVDYFVGDYKQSQRLVLGLLVLAEIARLGLEVTDRNEVQNLVNKYLDPSNPTQLKDEGFARLNDYANAGFSLIASAMDGAKPYQVETFLQWYARELGKRINANPFWASHLQQGNPA
jgi:hypothetical protein